MKPNLITPKELQEYLHCSKTTVYELCKSREFPSFKIGKNFYINADKLPEWIDKQCKREKF